MWRRRRKSSESRNRFLINASRKRSNCHARLIELHKVIKSLVHFIECKFSEERTFILRRSLPACCSHRRAMVVEVSTCQKDSRNLALSLLGRRREKLWRTAERSRKQSWVHMLIGIHEFSARSLASFELLSAVRTLTKKSLWWEIN